MVHMYGPLGLTSEKGVRERAQVTSIDNTLQDATVTLTVPSHPRYLYVVRSAVYPLAADAGFGKKGSRQIVLAVDEACTNIIKHAYGGASDRTITITVSDNPEKFTVRLRDFGVKADSATFLPRDLADIQPGRLGMHFIRQVFDAVTYDTSHRQGTELILEKRKQQVPV